MSKFIECEQGTEEWYTARAGLVTASMFSTAIDKIGGLNEQQQKFVDAVLKQSMTSKQAAEFAGYKSAPTAEAVLIALKGVSTERPSEAAKKYAAQLAIERVSNRMFGEPVKSWVLNRGHEMEAIGREIYESRNKQFVTESGICLLDCGPFAYSTDGLVDDDGLIEIKAPVCPLKIIGNWENLNLDEYKHQIQGGLWITGRKWCDFIMYVPDLLSAGKDMLIHRVYRDESFIDKMVAGLFQFDRLVQSYSEILKN